MGAHVEILQVRGEAYSSWSEKIVNDSDHLKKVQTQEIAEKNVDNEEDAPKCLPHAVFHPHRLVEKLRMKVDN